jgi:ABC-type Mn2+/Zn2+ transport system permease subunit
MELRPNIIVTSRRFERSVRGSLAEGIGLLRVDAGHIYAILLAGLFALAAGLVGSFALMKRMVLASDVMSHLALPGLGIAFLLKGNPLVGGGATLFLGTLLVWQLQKKTELATDASIGVVFAACLGIGALVTPNEDLLEALFGNFQKLSLFGFLLGAAAIILVLAFLFGMKDRLILDLFSPELAAATGVNVVYLDLGFMLVFSLTILVGLRFMGGLLSSALIIIPAATARHLTGKMAQFVILASAVSLISVGVGFLISTLILKTSTVGPTIVIVSVLVFVMSLLKKK